MPQLRTRIPRARVTLTYEDGTVIRQGDTEVKAEIFDKLLGSLDNRQLRQLAQSISELSLTRAAAERANELIAEASSRKNSAAAAAEGGWVEMPPLGPAQWEEPPPR